MKRIIVSALSLLILTAPALADHMGSIHFEIASPSGEFDEQVDNLGFGFNLDYAYHDDGLLAVGLGGDFLIYGHETSTLSLPLVEDFEYITDNNIASLFLLARLRGGNGRIMPYVEGRFGYSYIWTETKLGDEDWWDDTEIARETNFDDFATVWGGGGGLRIMLHEAERGDPESRDVMLDMKVIYRHGARATYLTEGAITIDAGDRVRIKPSTSETDLLQFMLGATIGF
jgi:hypothetical protein